MIIAFNRFCDVLRAVARIYVLILAAALFTIVISTVITRECCSWVLSWSEEVPRYLLIWISFMTAAVAVDIKDHIAFEYFYERMTGWGAIFLQNMVNVGILWFGGMMVIYGYQFVQDFGPDKMESIPFTNVWYYTSLPISGALIMIFSLRDILNYWFAPELRTIRVDLSAAAE